MITGTEQSFPLASGAVALGCVRATLQRDTFSVLWNVLDSFVYCVESIVLEFSIVSYLLLLFSHVYIECKWADLFPGPYFPTCSRLGALSLKGPFRRVF